MAPLIGYFKAEPTEYILAYSDGRLFRQGVGSTFWYWRPSTSIVLVPVATVDAPFVLNESTGNFQSVTLQGQITYRIAEPQRMAGLMNFTIDPLSRAYLSEDPDRLNQRIINVVQLYARQQLGGVSLEDALKSAERLAPAVLTGMREDDVLKTLGVEVLSLFFTSIKPTPEMAKALEAEYRESLQRRADQAIYSRRAEAVEQERKIKQNEMATAINLEERRQQLVGLQGENARKQAEFEADSTRIRLAPFQEVEPERLLALAFRDFAENAQKIGNLTISSEILERLFNRK